MNREDAAALYRQIRRRSHEEDARRFDQRVVALLAEHRISEPTPAHFAAAAALVTVPCRRCAGTGAFITHVVNGQPRGPGGPCYRCAGKGYRNDADERRNYGADIHQRVI